MKKFLSILLSVGMMLTFAGCGGGADGTAIYEAADKKMQELNSLDVFYTMEMTMKQGDQTMDVSSSMNMKMDSITSAENLRILGEGTTSADGQDIATMMYYENGYYYMEAAGQKIKYVMDFEAMLEAAEQSVGGNVNVAYMKEVKVNKDGDNQILTFTADASKMDDFVQEMMASMGNITGMEGVSYTIKEVNGEATVNKDGYFSNVKVNLSMDMSMGSESISVDMHMDQTYNNIGQPVEITAPADLDSYQEIDPGLLGL